MTGVPATPDMHFRNGAMAFTYMSTMLMELVDQSKVKLDDKLSKFLPDLPDADRITLKNLANMTSGYADYVYQPEVLHGVNLDPFRQWTPGGAHPDRHLDADDVSSPAPTGATRHTNYVILGRVLEKITGMPLADAMQKYIFGPMDLKQTRASTRRRFRSRCCTPSVPSVARISVFQPVYCSMKSRRSGIHRGPPPKARSRLPTSPT